jgi:hypothetical protein
MISTTAPAFTSAAIDDVPACEAFAASARTSAIIAVLMPAAKRSGMDPGSGAIVVFLVPPT